MIENINWRKLAIVGVATTILAFSTGYFLAYLTHNQSATTLNSEPHNQSNFTQQGQMSSSTRSERSAALDDVSDLEDLVRFKSHFERAVVLNELLQDATVGTLQTHLEQSKSISSTHLRESTQQAILQRLATLNPKVALEQIEEMPIETRQLPIQTVFQEWSLANLDQAIERASQLDSTSKLIALEGILVSTDYMTQKERRAIARRLGNEWLVIEKIEKKTGSELFEDPESEWNAFLKNNENNLQSLSDAQSKMLVFISSAWIEREGVEVFERMRESFPAQYPLSELISSVVNELFPHAPGAALALAANVEGIGRRQREMLTGEVLTLWAENAPQEALEAVSLINGRYIRRQLQAIVLETWAATDAYTLFSLIESLPTDMQDVATEKTLIALAKTTPTDAVELLNDIPDRHSHIKVAESIAIHWAKQDVFGALNWIESDERLASVQEHLMEKVFTELAQTDPQLAFDTALTYPPDSDDRGMEVAVLRRLAFAGDLDRAISLLPQTRTGATRTHAYESIINSLLLVEEDSMRTQDAVDLFIQATKTESVNDIEFMLMNVAWKAPLLLFESVNDLPSEELMRKVARSLLVHNETNGMFTEDQLAELQERWDQGE